MIQNKYFQRFWLIALLVVPLILWLLPPTFFDGENGIVLCPSRRILGIECLGCGMTRAVMHLHHFELSEALHFNKGVVLAYPVLIFIWIVWVKRTVLEVKKNQ